MPTILTCILVTPMVYWRQWRMPAVAVATLLVFGVLAAGRIASWGPFGTYS